MGFFRNLFSRKDSSVKILEKMKDVIKERGWNTGQFENAQGEVCLLGAWCIASKLSDSPRLETSDLAEVFANEYTPGNKPKELELLAECATVSSGLYARDYTQENAWSLYKVNDRSKGVEEIYSLIDCAIAKAKG